MLRNNEFEVSMDEQRFKTFLETNNQIRNRIHDMIVSHVTYIFHGISQKERRMIQLWTNPEICSALQRMLRGNMQPDSTDLERLKAVVELTNKDIFSRGKHIREEIRQATTQAEKERRVHDLIKYILDEFVMTLATTVYQAPRLQMYFFTFRGIHGNIVQRYTSLATNDIILERGFTSVTWQPLKAIEYAKGDGRDPPSYLMCVGLPSNSHALSVFNMSSYPNDREFLLPAGTVLERTPSGSFNVIGIYERFLNVHDPTQHQYNEWFRAPPAHTFDRDERDMMTSVQQTMLGHFNFGKLQTSQHYEDTSELYHTNPKMNRSTLNDTTAFTVSDSYDVTSTNLPNGVRVTQKKLPNQKIPTNSVSLNFDVLGRTHEIETHVNERGGISTFFRRKSR